MCSHVAIKQLAGFEHTPFTVKILLSWNPICATNIKQLLHTMANRLVRLLEGGACSSPSNCWTVRISSFFREFNISNRSRDS